MTYKHYTYFLTLDMVASKPEDSKFLTRYGVEETQEDLGKEAERLAQVLLDKFIAEYGQPLSVEKKIQTWPPHMVTEEEINKMLASRPK